MLYFRACSPVDFARGLTTMALGIYAFMSGAFFLGALSWVLMMSIRQDFRQWLQSKLPNFSTSQFSVLRGAHRLISGLGAFLQWAGVYHFLGINRSFEGGKPDVDGKSKPENPSSRGEVSGSNKEGLPSDQPHDGKDSDSERVAAVQLIQDAWNARVLKKSVSPETGEKRLGVGTQRRSRSPSVTAAAAEAREDGTPVVEIPEGEARDDNLGFSVTSAQSLTAEAIAEVAATVADPQRLEDAELLGDNAQSPTAEAKEEVAGTVADPQRLEDAEFLGDNAQSPTAVAENEQVGGIDTEDEEGVSIHRLFDEGEGEERSPFSADDVDRDNTGGGSPSVTGAISGL